MATKKSMWVLFGILVISAWVLGSAIQAGAETMNFKLYSWVIKIESVPVGDMEEHAIGLIMRGAFYVFENGEVASVNMATTIDYIKGSGPYTQYITINFADGSTIITKLQGRRVFTDSPSDVLLTNEITKGTGRFEGIKGTLSPKSKLLPLEKGEVFPKTYGEGTITYTLPTK